MCNICKCSTKQHHMSPVKRQSAFYLCVLCTRYYVRTPYATRKNILLVVCILNDLPSHFNTDGRAKYEIVRKWHNFSWSKTSTGNHSSRLFPASGYVNLYFGLVPIKILSWSKACLPRTNWTWLVWAKPEQSMDLTTHSAKFGVTKASQCFKLQQSILPLTGHSGRG